MTTPDHLADRSIAVQRSPEFQGLRRSFFTFIAPFTALFLLWYLAYVLLAGFAPDVFATRIGDSMITVGLLFGLGQFVTTFAITMLYRSWANRRYDAHAAAIREEMERGELDGPAHDEEAAR
ncbi:MULTISPECIES: DUF485 domain-containing protein [unclassified Agrococcus]|uniref:DUF485 domain-containing protein n=1 Tax=unclassified Agrococcus TaxID=2615065 RepID=UPI00360F4674